MKILLLFLIFLSPLIKSQNELHTKKNIKLFADYLFCSKDYLRAADEYKRFLLLEENDSIKYRLALSYLNIKELKRAENLFVSFADNSVFKAESERELFKTLFLQEDYEKLRNLYSEKRTNYTPDFQEENSLKKLYLFSYFFTDNKLPSKDEFINSFKNYDRNITDFYDRKINPPYKNQFLAGILSAIIPGAGKIYTKNYTDGIFAFLTTGIFSFLAYDNFRADHKFRAWLFTGIASLFYAGNIYGSVSSAQLYNVKIRFNFNADLNHFLSSNNYFIPDYNFCR